MYDERYGGHIELATTPLVSDKASMLDLLSIYETKFYEREMGGHSEYRRYNVANDASYMLRDVDREVYYLHPIFLWVSVGLSIVSVLFVMYHSSGVVISKSREIGILRALGASKKDVLAIFCSGNGLLAAAIIVISTILSAIGVTVANAWLTADFGGQIVAISFGFVPFIVLAAVAILAVAAGVAFPVIKLLKKKPVDVIADRK